MKTDDKELEDIVRKFTKGLLDEEEPRGMCFAVSCALSGYLIFLGYENKVVEGEIVLDGDIYQHYWINYKNMIIDPTANQFIHPDGGEMPDIYIGEKPDWYSEVKR